MVSILQALKVSLLFILFGLIPLVVALLALVILIAGEIDIGGRYLTMEFSILLPVLIITLYIFFVGLLKAIGDITEAALIE